MRGSSSSIMIIKSSQKQPLTLSVTGLLILTFTATRKSNGPKSF